MSDHSEWVADVLERAADACKGKAVLALQLHIIHDELVAWAKDEHDDCLHYDHPPMRKFKGELVCGGCSVIFGYWSEPPLVLPVPWRP